MRKNTHIRKIANASLALFISVSPLATAMEVKSDEGKSLALPRNTYETILQEIKELTDRIHREVDQVLADYKRDTEEYHRRMGVNRVATTTTLLTDRLEEGVPKPEGQGAREQQSLEDLVKAEQYLQEEAKKRAEEAANEEFNQENNKDILAKRLGLQVYDSDESFKDALYLRQILGVNESYNLARIEEYKVNESYNLAWIKKYKKHYGRRPTEAQFLAMKQKHNS